MEAILNFRDLADAAPGLVPGRVFRCARPCFASEADVAALRDTHGVRLLLDLRTAEEIAHARESGGAFYAAIDAGEFEHRSLPLMTKDTYRAGLMKRMGKRLKLRVGAAALKAKAGRQDEEAMREAVVPVMRDFLNASGLIGLNEILLEIGGASIASALAALSGDRPTLIFCTAGKDRTGLLSALALSVAGADEAAVVADYARSHALRSSFDTEPYAGAVRRLGLDADAFLGAPPENMVATLAHLAETYGGAERYLESIGMDAEAMATLRARLTVA